MDEFAQSREDDDLFADEFEPVSVPIEVVEAAPPPQPRTQQTNVSRGNKPSNRGRGRGRDAPQAGLAASRFAPKSELSQSQPQPQKQPQSQRQPQSQPQPQPQPQKQTSSDGESEPKTTEVATSEPLTSEPHHPGEDAAQQPATQRTPAVRGDRSLTGGPSKKKLTEEELTAKLEKMAILNAAKSEKHRLTELDQAQFQNREAEMAKERREKEIRERRERGQLEAERRANRERKMKGMGGREWDVGKEELIAEEAKKGRSSEYVRGGHGGVKRGGLAGSRFADVGDHAAPITEEQQGRGNGRRSLNIRGRGNNSRGRGKRSQPMIPAKAEDFPSLPKPVKSESAKAGSPKTGQSITKPAKVEVEKVLPPKLVSAADHGYTEESKGELGASSKDKPHDWAEEMATPSEEKKMNLTVESK